MHAYKGKGNRIFYIATNGEIHEVADCLQAEKAAKLMLNIPIYPAYRPDPAVVAQVRAAIAARKLLRKSVASSYTDTAR